MRTTNHSCCLSFLGVYRTAEGKWYGVCVCVCVCARVCLCAHFLYGPWYVLTFALWRRGSVPVPEVTGEVGGGEGVEKWEGEEMEG